MRVDLANVGPSATCRVMCVVRAGKSQVIDPSEDVLLKL